MPEPEWPLHSACFLRQGCYSTSRGATGPQPCVAAQLDLSEGRAATGSDSTAGLFTLDGFPGPCESGRQRQLADTCQT
jgi:hypothetical protein